jgi:anthranilate/para-aminobenzoate synthase component I
VFDLDAIRVRLDGDGWHAPAPAGPPLALLWGDARTGRAVLQGRDVERTWNDPLAALAWMAIDGRRAGCRWIGYLSYDLGRWFERLPSPPPDDLGLPLFAFTLHGQGEPLPDAQPERVPPAAAARSNFARPAYESAVARAIDYIRAGDVFQVNLSQRFTVPTDDPATALYARLRRASPARFGGCLDYGPFAIVSNSPELFLRVSPDGRAVTRPIKGTRPNRPGMAEQLRASAKDAAELHMIVDLERNDLGRVCRVGTVRVTQPRTVEAHPTVLHGVATVEGHLRPDVTFVDLLRATFPGGSVTGAPKVRAMQIIDELEPVRRGPYCGAIGYVAADGTMEFNVAIRTMTIKDGTAYVPVGGGIVADSEPAAEYDETLVKASAMFAALGVGR